MHQFDHRWASYEDPDDPVLLDDARKENTRLVALPRYWVPDRDVWTKLADRWNHEWILCWRKITNVANERTLVAGIVPKSAIGDSLFCVLSDQESCWALSSNMSAFVLDYVARQKLGGVNASLYLVNQLPVLDPAVYEMACVWESGSMVLDWMRPRVLELTYTAWDLQPFGRDLGYDGPPFRWDPERRFILRCELDAAFFHLYGVSRDDADYIMDTFPIVRRKDEAAHGEYRTKRVILEIYDELARATSSGVPYRSRLDPPPGDPRAAHVG